MNAGLFGSPLKLIDWREVAQLLTDISLELMLRSLGGLLGQHAFGVHDLTPV